MLSIGPQRWIFELGLRHREIKPRKLQQPWSSVRRALLRQREQALCGAVVLVDRAGHDLLRKCTYRPCRLKKAPLVSLVNSNTKKKRPTVTPGRLAATGTTLRD
jgi:hypothetical protein